MQSIDDVKILAQQAATKAQQPFVVYKTYVGYKFTSKATFKGKIVETILPKPRPNTNTEVSGDTANKKPPITEKKKAGNTDKK